MTFQVDTLKTISGKYICVLKQSNSPLAGSFMLNIHSSRTGTIAGEITQLRIHLGYADHRAG